MLFLVTPSTVLNSPYEDLTVGLRRTEKTVEEVASKGERLTQNGMP